MEVPAPSPAPGTPATPHGVECMANGATVVRRKGDACSLGIVIHPSDVHEGGRLVALFRSRASDAGEWELNRDGLLLEDVPAGELEAAAVNPGNSCEFLAHFDGAVPWLDPTKRKGQPKTKGLYFSSEDDGAGCTRKQKIAYLLARTVWLGRMRNSKGKAPSQMSNDFLEWLDKNCTWFWQHSLVKPLSTRAFDRLLNQITVASKRIKSRAGAILAAVAEDGSALRAKKSKHSRPASSMGESSSSSSSSSSSAGQKKAKTSARPSGDENQPPYFGAGAKAPISLLSPASPSALHSGSMTPLPMSSSSAAAAEATDGGGCGMSVAAFSWYQALGFPHQQPEPWQEEQNQLAPVGTSVGDADTALAQVLLGLRNGGGGGGGGGVFI